MTAGEAGELIVDLTRQLAAARGEANGHRLVAHAAVRQLHEQHVELEALRARYHKLRDERRQQSPRGSQDVISGIVTPRVTEAAA